MNYFIALDVETGGTDPDVHALMEVGMIAMDPTTGAILNQFQTYIQRYPAMYDPEAIKVNKISDVQLSQGMPYKNCYEHVRDFFAQYNSRPNTNQNNSGKFNDRFLPIIIAHNALFDLSFLEVLFEKNDDNLYRHIRQCHIDTMTWAAGIQPLEAQNLPTLAKHFGVQYDNGHTALHDAKVAGLIALQGFQRMKQSTSKVNEQVLKFNF